MLSDLACSFVLWAGGRRKAENAADHFKRL